MLTKVLVCAACWGRRHSRTAGERQESAKADAGSAADIELGRRKISNAHSVSDRLYGPASRSTSRSTSTSVYGGGRGVLICPSVGTASKRVSGSGVGGDSLVHAYHSMLIGGAQPYLNCDDEAI